MNSRCVVPLIFFLCCGQATIELRGGTLVHVCAAVRRYYAGFGILSARRTPVAS